MVTSLSSINRLLIFNPLPRIGNQIFHLSGFSLNKVNLYDKTNQCLQIQNLIMASSLEEAVPLLKAD